MREQLQDDLESLRKESEANRARAEAAEEAAAEAAAAASVQATAAAADNSPHAKALEVCQERDALEAKLHGVQEQLTATEEQLRIARATSQEKEQQLEQQLEHQLEAGEAQLADARREYEEEISSLETMVEQIAEAVPEVAARGHGGAALRAGRAVCSALIDSEGAVQALELQLRAALDAAALKAQELEEMEEAAVQAAKHAAKRSVEQRSATEWRLEQELSVATRRLAQADVELAELVEQRHRVADEGDDVAAPGATPTAADLAAVQAAAEQARVEAAEAAVRQQQQLQLGLVDLQAQLQRREDEVARLRASKGRVARVDGDVPREGAGESCDVRGGSGRMVKGFRNVCGLGLATSTDFHRLPPAPTGSLCCPPSTATDHRPPLPPGVLDELEEMLMEMEVALQRRGAVLPCEQNG